MGAVPIGTLQLRVSRAGDSQTLPLRQVNMVEKGFKVAYTPVRLPQETKKNGKVALVVMPQDEKSGGVTVLDLLPAGGSGEWVMPFQVAMLALVFGPQGLDEKRVSHLVSKDSDLMSELAVYAQDTEDLEAVMDQAATAEDGDEEEQLDRPAHGTEQDQLLYAISRALNPVLTAYNPLGAGKRAGPATNKGRAAGMFFDNAGGFVPGGGALPTVKTFLMPDTEFRSVYSKPEGPLSMTLCGQRLSNPGRNRIAYLWAHRLVNSGAPAISLAEPIWLPLGVRSSTPVKAKSTAQWQLISRFRDWTLAGGAAPIPVKVRADQPRAIEVNLRKNPAPAGTYRLEGKWDWQTVPIAGEFHLGPLGELKKAALAEDARERLVGGRGVVEVAFQGTDFEFVERVSLRKPGWLGQSPVDLEYALPKGLRAGPQDKVNVQIDTDGLASGEYLLAFAQTGGSTQDVPVNVQPPPPKIDNLPLRANTGAGEQRFVLKGSDVDRIEAITADGAAIRLGAPAGAGEREVFVTLKDGAKKGDRIAFAVKITGAPTDVRIANGIAVLGPRPRIAGVKATLPDQLSVPLREGELPAGSFVGFSIQLGEPDPQPVLRLECKEPERTLQAVRVRPGEKLAAVKLEAPGENALFASLDPGGIGRTGCTLTAAVETESAGTSEAVALGRIVRLPRIEGVTLTNEKADPGFAAVLKGRDLETIEKTGWDAANGLPVPGPPRSLAGEGDRETMRIIVTWPSPSPMAPLFIWLAGDKEGRAIARPGG